jgi:hypothetical protein
MPYLQASKIKLFAGITEFSILLNTALNVQASVATGDDSSNTVD